MDTIKLNSNNTKIIAHRGLSGIETENTVSAFVAAANRSYYGVETDVHITKDGKYIIIHDDDTKRVSDTNYIVEQTDFDTLRSIKLHNSNSQIDRCDLMLPTLEEYYDVCHKYEKIAVLELKNDMEKKDIENIAEIITKLNMLNNTVFISFSLDNLIKLKEIDKNVSAQYLISEITDIDGLISVLKNNSLDVDAYHGALTKEIIDKMHENDIKVNAWTVDDFDRANELIEFDIDYITTNILE